MKSAIAIRHVAFEDLGNLAAVLEQQEYTISYVEAGTDDLRKIDQLSPDLVIILGGPIGAYDEKDYPFLLDELRLLERRLTADLPTLGICLGAQLIARVLGSKVYPGHGKEIGWSPIILTEAGRRSALRHLTTELVSVLHWHGDTFELPSNCIHLASSAKYENQAFAYKQNGLALQFHPEVTTQGLERWFIGHICEINATPSVSIANLRQDTAHHSERLQAQAMLFWREWLDSIESPSQTQPALRLA